MEQSMRILYILVHAANRKHSYISYKITEQKLSKHKTDNRELVIFLFISLSKIIKHENTKVDKKRSIEIIIINTQS